ncbi:zonadhesin-like isoform X2 [Cydia splendana]|uniref:zonadhesin-like isoform X2 n=1 Tax=Cydia splendana TaxID=1100963 RepID=UPI00300D6D4C
MENCPPKPCGENQTWVSCDRPCPYQRCPRDDKPPPPCVKIEPCYPGCQCKLNYLRNSSGDCILAPECPPVNCTRLNEEWDGCPSTCLAEGCDNIYNQPTTCNTLIWLCSPRCVCKKGHFRNKDGICIPASQCPTYCKDPNASWRNCLDICPGTCQNPKPICMSKVAVCRPGCQCKKGYVLDKPGNGGKCVKIEKCPVTTTSAPITTTTPAPPKCKSNEHWTDCLPGQCKPKTCDELIKPAPCPRVIPPCPGGCICDDGYVWDATGCCIKKEDCPSYCKDPNASWRDCRDICPGTCQNPKPICMSKVACRPGCQCKKGYVLDKPGDGGKCVKIEKCPAKQCKGSHEIYILCPAGQCNAKTCDDLVNPPGCPRIKPPCPGGCICEDGYLRDKYGKCIPKEQCPSLQCKKKNERWSNCVLGECVPRDCEDVGYPVPCPDIIGPCAGGCTCIEGFVRNCEGECIDMKDCPCCGGDPNAVSGCGNPCGKTCASLYANNSDLICPQYCEYNGCDCKPGYRLLTDSTDGTESKKCVPESECPKPTPQCGANEQYYCGTSCPEASCVDPTPPTCVNKKCKLACFCKKGFVRDFNNTCIPVNKCPKCKGPHERLISCPIGQCNPKTCKDLIKPPGCPRVIPPCPDGCVCEEGYLRDANGKCIEKSLCPGVCKDPNASWTDCRNPCPGTCYNTKPVCPTKPCSPGCQCNEGYVLSKQGKDGKCVKIETCADYIHCPCNQTFVPCTFKGCPQVRCPESDQTILCKPPRDCPGGCGCKPYYRYDVNNNCIKSTDCPPVECTRAHEVWKCKHLGDWEYCDERYNSPPFVPGDPDDCEPKCACEQGYWRNPQTNTCVTENECPPI